MFWYPEKILNKCMFSISPLAPLNANQLGTNTLNSITLKCPIKRKKSLRNRFNALVSTSSVYQQQIKRLKTRAFWEFCESDKTIFKICLASKFQYPFKEKWQHVLSKKSYNLSLKRYVVNYAPQCYNANAPSCLLVYYY